MGKLFNWHSVLYMLPAFFFLCILRMKSSKGEDYDVIVVGGGLAGLSAAIAANEQGAKVLLLEKGDRIGGNSAKATSGINGVGTEAQALHNVEDSVESFIEDTLRSGGGRSDRDAVEVLATGSQEAVRWLCDQGLELISLTQLGGHSAKRTHRIPPGPDGRPRPVGFTIIQKLSELAKKLENVQVVVNAEVTRLLTLPTDGFIEVVGVVYKNLTIPQESASPEIQVKASAVILTTGGYAYDRSENSLLKEFVPELLNLPTTSGPLALGEGVRMGRAISAALVDMDQVQVHPTGFVDLQKPAEKSKFLAPESLRGSGAILVDATGARFANELGTRDYLTEMIASHCSALPNSDGQRIGYMVLTEEGAKQFGTESLKFYISKGLVHNLENASSAASKFGFDQDTLKKTFQTYTQDALRGHDQYGKTVFPSATFSTISPLYIAAVTPCIHYTMGGLKMNPSTAEVMRKTNQVPELFSAIPGLYAAGEVTGGVHGTNRLGGNSLLECVVFGRLAGIKAAQKASFVNARHVSTLIKEVAHVQTEL